MFRYTLRKENLFNPDIGCYISFGIAAFEETDSGWVHCAFVSDVSTDHDAVLDLVRRCNKHQLSPIHLWDVIEDFLNA